MGKQQPMTLVVALGLGLIACGGASELAAPAFQVPESIPRVGNANELLIVDCALPAKVKKLGTQLTYLAPRRPIKTAAVDCEIRGGEYVAYDRASYQTALQVWRPMAEGGDPKAQTYVGEIYEKGLGVPPDYAHAADWYRRAADQGYAPAQINLGQLYEQGLSVEKDVDVALDWYRKASGLQDLGLQFVTFMNDAKAQQALESRLASSAGERAKLKRQIVGLQRRVAEASALRSDFDFDVEAERQALLDESRTLRRMRIDLEFERERLTALPDPALAEQQRAAELDRRAAELSARDEAVYEGERRLEQRQRELANIEAKIEALSRETESSRAKVVQLARADQLGIPGPTIHLVDPALLKTRSAEAQPILVSGREHKVVGRVDAPAGLLTLMINEIEADVSPDGYFDTRVRVRRGGTPIGIVAVDRQGKRADRNFVLRTATVGAVSSPPPASDPSPAPSGVKFGRYYALVIGNQNYERLPNLDTARADAQAVARILKDRYGFTVIPRYDANRYQILYILNELRSRLTENDNLVVYYAGHGELDKVNERGHWLPVDADPKSSVNWISNVQITDILNAMRAKHVMVIADSCYSGTLTEAAVAQLEPDLPADERRAWQKAISEKRSRTALTSGGLAPVLDGGGGADHSVFANALLGVLSQNDDVIEGRRLHREVAARVTYAARKLQFEQLPRYAPIKHGGHEAGDFLLVPRS